MARTEHISTVIASHMHGRRRIMGTDWPITTTVWRHGPPGNRSWEVVFRLCNGVPSDCERYETRREALEAAGLQLGEYRDDEEKTVTIRYSGRSGRQHEEQVPATEAEARRQQLRQLSGVDALSVR
jgi:hypothetical protein